MTDLVWGIGIEHETILLTGITESKKGSEILDNLNYRNTFESQKYIENLLIPDENYVIYIANSKLYNRLFKLVDLEFLNKMVELENSKLNELINEYLKFIPDKDFEDTWNLVDISNTLSFSEDLDNTLRKYRLVITYIVDNTSRDGTVTHKVLEFKTVNYQNQLITDIVEELSLKENIIKLLLELKYSKSFYYPLTGSIFPLSCYKTFYCLDYTGSYHLNLSMPYSQKLLETEKLNWEKETQKFKEGFEKITNIFSESDNKVKKEILESSIFINKILSYLQKEIKNTYNYTKNLTYLTDYLFNVEEIYNKKKPISLKRIFIDSTDFISKGVNITQLDFYAYIYDIPIYLISIFPSESTYWNRYQNIETKKTINKDKDFFLNLEKIVMEKGKDYLICFNNDNTIILIKRSTGFEYNINEFIDKKINSSFKLYYKFIFPNWFRDNLKNLLKNNYIDVVNDKIRVLINPIITQYNLEIKYSSGFHFKHKIWAVAIQYLLPIILSCFSSCDPLSVNAHKKLSELSLRLFISGYSFINFADILRFDIPDEREIYSWQDEPVLKKYLVEKYPYWNDVPLIQIDGTEYRADEERGFEFGFELRVFDNFAIEHIDVLLEFLFLFLDHLDVVDILEKGIVDNPFNNPIINKQIIQIIENGWNTELNDDYLELIKHKLEINIEFSNNIYAYDCCNLIYKYLQENYKGNGNYSKYMITNTVIKDLPNINRLSWEINFKELLYDKDIKLRQLIDQSLKISNTNEELISNLSESITTNYDIDIMDIFFYLESFKN